MKGRLPTDFALNVMRPGVRSATILKNTNLMMSNLTTGAKNAGPLLIAEPIYPGAYICPFFRRLDLI
jgi:hypothetical protein